MIVIIPGWMHAASHWSAVSEQLTRQGVINTVLDVPGFGTVPVDPDITTINDLTAWCNREIVAIQATANTPLVLVGHSCGGRIALKLVSDGLQAQELVLIGSPNLYRPSPLVRTIKFLAFVSSPLKPLIPTTLRNILRSIDYKNAKNTDMHQLYLSVVKDDQTHLLSKISMSVHLIWGELDDAAPVRIAKELHAHLSLSHLTILPKLGHNLHHENPLLLAGKLAKYAQTS